MQAASLLGGPAELKFAHEATGLRITLPEPGTSGSGGRNYPVGNDSMIDCLPGVMISC
jgi:hypothetical protein